MSKPKEMPEMILAQCGMYGCIWGSGRKYIDDHIDEVGSGEAEIYYSYSYVMKAIDKAFKSRSKNERL